MKLAFSQNIGLAMEFANKNNFDTAAMHLAKAATLVRKEMVSKRHSFTGTFTAAAKRNQSLIA